MFIFFAQGFLFFALGFLPLIFFFVDTATLFAVEIDSAVLLLAGLVYYLYIALFLLYAFFDYYLDIWIITDHELIHAEQLSLFNRTSAKQELSRVQDVEVKVKGLFQTIFNYGDIFVQTAGTQERITFQQVPRPHAVADLIMKRVHAVKQDC